MVSEAYLSDKYLSRKPSILLYEVLTATLELSCLLDSVLPQNLQVEGECFKNVVIGANSLRTYLQGTTFVFGEMQMNFDRPIT